MIDCSVFIATSVDGFIARLDGALDWLPQDSIEDHGYTAFMQTIDALVLGRTTYETVLGFGVWPYGTLPVYVLSSRELPVPLPDGAVVERLAGSPRELAQTLAARGVTRAYIDGGKTIQQFLRAGMISRFVITRIPVLLGSGVPLFGALDADLRLIHVQTQTFSSGMVQTEYRADAST